MGKNRLKYSHLDNTCIVSTIFITQGQAPSSRRSQTRWAHPWRQCWIELHRTVPITATGDRSTRAARVSGEDVSASGLAGGAFSKQALGGRTKHQTQGSARCTNPPPSPWPWRVGASISFRRQNTSSCGPVMTKVLHILTKLLPTSSKSQAPRLGLNSSLPLRRALSDDPACPFPSYCHSSIRREHSPLQPTHAHGPVLFLALRVGMCTLYSISGWC
jgi:hypothetical protein